MTHHQRHGGPAERKSAAGCLMRLTQSVQSLLSGSRTFRPGRRRRKAALSAVAEVAETRALLSGIQLAPQGNLNADLVANRTGGVTDDGTAPGVNGLNEFFITQSAASAAGGAAGNGLPDDGVFSETRFHPRVDLWYDNTDNGNNAVTLSDSAQTSALFQVPSGRYRAVHIFAVAASGTTELTVNQTYIGRARSDRTDVAAWDTESVEVTSTLVTADSYELIDGTDKLESGSWINSNDQAVFGLKLNLAETHRLSELRLTVPPGASAVHVLGITLDAAALVVDSPATSIDGDYSVGNLSLPEAVQLANQHPDSDRIEFAESLHGQTIGPIGELTLNHRIMIAGPGADRLTLTAGGAGRHFTVPTTGDAEISGVTLSDGNGGFVGGAVNNNGRLAVTGVAFRNNSATHGGAVNSWVNGHSTQLTVSGSEFTGNTASGDGGAIHLFGSGSAVVHNSTFTGNQAQNGGGAVYDGTGVGGRLTITASTFTQNAADTDGSGGSSEGGGAVRIAGAAEVRLHNVLADDNIRNSAAGFSPDDVNGPVHADSSHNIVGAGVGLANVSSGSNDNQIGTSGSPLDAQIGPAGLHGGSTRSHSITTGGPAAAAGSPLHPLVTSYTFDNPLQPLSDSIGAYDLTAVGHVSIIPTSFDAAAGRSVFFSTDLFASGYLETSGALPIGGSDFSIAVRIRPQRPAGQFQTFDPIGTIMDVPTTNGNARWWIDDAGRVRLSWNSRSFVGLHDTLVTGDRHQIVWVRDTAADRMRIFIDGTEGQVAELSGTGTLLPADAGTSESFTGSARIGAPLTESASDLNAQLDELSFYDRVLSAGEVERMYRVGSPVADQRGQRRLTPLPTVAVGSFQPASDYGDAPGSAQSGFAGDYPIGSAGHTAVGPMLGSRRDTEVIGQTDPHASADDLRADPFNHSGLVSLSGMPVGDIVAADADRDGDTDLFVGIGGEGEDFPVSHLVLLNDGTGAFSASRSLSFGNIPDRAVNDVVDIHAADLNSDGYPELLSLNGADSPALRIIHNGAADPFVNSDLISVGADFVPAKIGTGRFDGDALADILLFGYTVGNVPQIRVLPAGAFGFGSPVIVDIGTPPDDVTAVEFSDLNADGRVDIAFTTSDTGGTSASPTVRSVLRTFISNGDLTATPVTEISSADGVIRSRLLIADVTGDRLPDAVFQEGQVFGGFAVDWNALVVLPGDGLGGFGASIAMSDPSLPGQPITAGDVNGDGTAEIIVSGGAVVVSDGSGGFLPPLITDRYSVDVLNRTDRPLVTADLNGDGHADAVGPAEDRHGLALLIAADDEDGVTFEHEGVVAPSDSFDIGVRLSQVNPAGTFLRGWIDWNRDGDWDDAGELVIDRTYMSGSTVAETFSVSVPPTASGGKTFARFRVTTAVPPGPDGSLPDGETEDYPIFIQQPAVILAPSSVTSEQQPLFQWEPVNGIRLWHLEVDNLTTGQTGVILQSVEDTVFRPEQRLTLGQYRVRVRGVRPDGGLLPLSPWHTFSVRTKAVIRGPEYLNRTTPVTFSWEPVAGATHYDLWVNNTSSGQQQIIRETAIVSTSFTTSIPLPLGNYAFWVKAIGTGGLEGTWSGEIFRNVPTPVMTMPVGGTFDATPTFDWEDIASADSYDLWVARSFPNPDPQVIRQTALTTSEFTATGSLPYGKYIWWVQPKDSAGNKGSWSAASVFWSQGRTEMISPTGEIGDLTPTYEWMPSTGATGYDLWVGEQGGGPVYTQNNITGTSHTPADALSPDKQYVAYVRARSGSTLSVWSPAMSFSIPARPAAPVITPLTGLLQSGQPVLQWSATAGDGYYDVWIDRIGGASQIVRESVVMRSVYRPTSPLPSGSYRVWVRAITAGGLAGAWSTPYDFVVA